MTEQALSEEEPHFCTNCGSPINSADKFCTNCGAPIQRGSVAASDSGEAQASGDGNSEQAGAYGEAQAAQPVEPVAPTDATPVAAAVPAPVAAEAEVASAVEQAVSEAEQAANTAQPTASAAVAVKKPHKKAGAIAAAIVGTVVIASVLIILGLMQLNVLANPFAKARPVTFAIKAPHYNEKTDSKIPLHITGKTVSGKVISQHVYVSPKAPVVHLDPGVYKVQVEASPLMSSGEFYKTPAPLTVDTRSANAVISTAQPAKPQLTFEVKPANEVTQQDIALAEKFAKKTKFDAPKIKNVEVSYTRKRIASLYNSVLDGLDPNNYSTYSIHDINADGFPELLVRNKYDPDAGAKEYGGNISVWTFSEETKEVEKVQGSIPFYRGYSGDLADEYSVKGDGVQPSYETNDDEASYEIYTFRDGKVTVNVRATNSSDGFEFINYLPLKNRDLLNVYGLSLDKLIYKLPSQLNADQKLALSTAAQQGKLPISGVIRVYDAAEIDKQLMTRMQLSKSDLLRPEAELSHEKSVYLEVDNPNMDIPRNNGFIYSAEIKKQSPLDFLMFGGKHFSETEFSRLKKYENKKVVVTGGYFFTYQSPDLPIDMTVAVDSQVVAEIN